MVVLVAVYGAGHGVLQRRRSTRSCRTSCRPRELAQANSLDQFVRPLALRLAGPALGGVLVDVRGRRLRVRARRGVVRGLGARAAGDARAAARAQRARAARSAATIRAGFATSAATSGCGRRSRRPRSPTCCSWGRPRCCSRTSSRTSSAAAPADLGLVFAAGGLGSLGCARRDGPARAAAARHHVHVRRVDARDAGGGRLRPGGRGLAADAREPRVQRARDGGHDRLGDGQAAPRAAGAARPRLEPRLADLDRAAAAVLRAHRPGERRDRRAGHAGRRGPRSAASSRSPRCCCPACARSRAARPRPPPRVAGRSRRARARACCASAATCRGRSATPCASAASAR